jgi:hypothetical protein
LKFVSGQVSKRPFGVFEFQDFPAIRTTARQYLRKTILNCLLRLVQFRLKTRRVQLEHGVLVSLLPFEQNTGIGNDLHDDILLIETITGHGLAEALRDNSRADLRADAKWDGKSQQRRMQVDKADSAGEDVVGLELAE